MKKTITISLDENVVGWLDEYLKLRNHDGVVVPMTLSSITATRASIGVQLVLGRLNDARIAAINEDAQKLWKRAGQKNH